MMTTRAERRPKQRMAPERTDFVGKRRIRGAMAMEPTHWKAWLRPWRMAKFLKVPFSLKRSEASKVMEPVKASYLIKVIRRL